MAPPTGRPGPSRRNVLSWAALGAAGVAGSGLLSGCSSSGATQITFLENKPEVIPYFNKLVSQFNKSHPKIHATQNSSTTPLTPQFVRGDPPDLACYNFQLEAANFLARGALSNLADLPQAKKIKPAMQDLVSQFATWKGETCALPYSVAAAGVIYRPDLFSKYDVAIPTTWTELLAACAKFKAAGVTPIYYTDMDLWTLQQGIFDYCVGGSINVAEFFKNLTAAGGNVNKNSPVSFTKNFADACSKMLQLYKFRNSNAPSLGYNIGNSQFFNGKGAAMYFQGPWALLPLSQANPKVALKTFALPLTDNPNDRKVRANLDLALWIPNASSHQEEARTMLQWLMQPEIINAYNKSALATAPTLDAPIQNDPRVVGISQYVADGKIYQGATTFISSSIAFGNWIQAMLLDGRDTSSNINSFLNKLDTAWANRAQRSAG
ncbi:ABC transporter substrate-binding protein [Flexivirga caeni]|uniref:Extracellular solute-binding protein n=1 Tax=Flexivirga caeni TaxID=2294115 RepID=A0A3M9M2R9_9MICO|nr:extracellular solute-binding protein [Flexivirga caeni]RNI19850.1 extracellular solute-binding protein [Flexivirga caeni]